MLSLLFKYPRLILFGVLAAAFSGPGQTFLVSLFIPHIQAAFDLSKASVAGYYSLATLISAAILPLTGRVLDRSPLLLFSLVAGALLSTGCFLLGWSPNVLVVFVGFFLIRNLGQGTLTMVSSTTMARKFGPIRGKALGLSHLGYPLSEAIFPLLVATWIAMHPWRSGWMMLGTLVFLIYLPLTYFLLRDNPHVELSDADLQKTISEEEDHIAKHDAGRDWTVKEMLHDFRFYILMIPMMIPPTFFTGLFFHQISIYEWKGWDSNVIISFGFVLFGICRALLSFMIGPLIDRYTAKKLFPINLIPFAIGVLLLAVTEQQYWGLVYLGLSGMTMGLGMTMSAALYAEFYGTKALGSIKGITSALVVFSTAVSPVAMGYLFDQGVGTSTILWGMIMTLVVGTGCSVYVCRYQKSEEAAS